MSGENKFQGWVAHDKDSVNGNLKWEEYEPKKWTDDDVEIKITHCGICASDLHTLRSGWGPTLYPAVVGHEIVGTAVRVGKNVQHIKEGQRVGIGAQSGSCLSCAQCKRDLEPYCDNGLTGTYNGTYPHNGGKSYGGYADYARAPAHFAIPIPDSLDSAVAAPMLCGGVTVYSPLVDNGAGTTAKNVGIVGIGGLGHFGLIFAKALGAEKVLAISHTEGKRDLAKKLGATDFLATAGGAEVFKAHKRSLDLIVVTTNNADMPITDYLSLVKPGGKMVHVGIPEAPAMPTPIGPLILNGVNLGGSAIGSPKRIHEMLLLAAKQNLKPMIELRPMSKTNEAVVDMDAGKPRFRYVLVNEKNGGKL